MNKTTLIICAIISVVAVGGGGLFVYFFCLERRKAKHQPSNLQFSKTQAPTNIIQNFYTQGFIKNEWAFNYVLSNKNLNGKIQPGGYKISKSMTAWQVADTFSKGPYLIWVVIPEGLRKEQIAELLAKDLGWTDQQKSDWIINITSQNSNYFEGVYFPNTYLIPKDRNSGQYGSAAD